MTRDIGYGPSRRSLYGASPDIRPSMRGRALKPRGGDVAPEESVEMHPNKRPASLHGERPLSNTSRSTRPDPNRPSTDTKRDFKPVAVPDEVRVTSRSDDMENVVSYGGVEDPLTESTSRRILSQKDPTFVDESKDAFFEAYPDPEADQMRRINRLPQAALRILGGAALE